MDHLHTEQLQPIPYIPYINCYCGLWSHEKFYMHYEHQPVTHYSGHSNLQFLVRVECMRCPRLQAEPKVATIFVTA